MKPELRIQMLKEFERIKKNSDPRVGIVIVFATLLLCLLFVWNIADTNLIKFLLLIPFFLSLVYELYLLARYYIDKRISILFQAMLENQEGKEKKE
jgi:hypothetical protein